MSEHHPLDDRQHGHAIRRRQGGRTSMYHEQLYPKAAIEKALGDQGNSWGQFVAEGIRASDTSTGAY